MIAVKYSVFAAISTLLNLLFQYISFSFYSGIGELYMAMFWGTLAGLMSKYILDKKYIFYHTSRDMKDDFIRFMFYSLMGAFTTIIFWGAEILFDLMLDADYAKYLGAVVGLSIGYIIKYNLDKRYVFRDIVV